MKLIDSFLYLEFDEAVQAGIGSEGYLRKAKSVGSRSFTFINDPSDKRKVLLQFETLKPEHKALVEKRYGNPYDRLAKEPIKNMVSKDSKAEEFYLSYRYSDNKMLPIESVNKYTEAASWLNMLVKAKANKKDIKKLLNLSVADFFIKVGQIITEDNIDLPASYRRLTEKMTEYKGLSLISMENAYTSMISEHFGNQRAKKVSTELAESILLELLSLPYHDDVVLCRKYNEWAVNNGHEAISASTVGLWRRNNSHLIDGSRKGSKNWYNSHGKQIMRKRPSAPLLLIGSDDNDLDLYFQTETVNKKNHVQINYFHRFKLIVVMDAFNDYVLGYAQADTVTTDLIKLAFVDAMHHIRQLTGGWYLPHQLQTDRWGKGALDGFYKSIATYTPATAKVARAKYIERAFYDNWHKALRLYPNYAGTNITSKRKINEDHLALMKKEFPSKDYGPVQIEHFIQTLRTLVNEKTGMTKQQEWLQAFIESKLSQERMIPDMQFLHLFGQVHEYANTITNRGITPTLNGIERVYEIPEEFYLETVGKKVQVIYDPLDFSRVLVTDGDRVRFVAHSYELLPAAIADYKEGDRTRLNAKLDEKRRHVEAIAQSKANRQQVLDANKINVDSLLQAGVMAKDLMQGAIQQYGQVTYNSNEKPTKKSNEVDPLDLM